MVTARMIAAVVACLNVMIVLSLYDPVSAAYSGWR